jgi:hypothetical protein
MTLQTAGLWLYSALASLEFGATVYEALVVHPAWSRKPPESFVFVHGHVGRPHEPSRHIKPTMPNKMISADSMRAGFKGVSVPCATLPLNGGSVDAKSVLSPLYVLDLLS